MVARRLGWDTVDTDEEITRVAGKSISRIFAEDGEDYFRKLERQVIAEACAMKKTVIGTGGGAILDPRNREVMKKKGVIICLEATPETIYKRLVKDMESGAPPRPLIEVDNPLKRIKEMKESRQSYYALADWTVHTDEISLEDVCQEVIRGWHHYSRRDIVLERDLACEVVTLTERYPVFVEWGSLYSMGNKVSKLGLNGNAHIISDETVFFIYGTRVMESLSHAGFTVNSFVVPPGEATKTLDTANKIYDWLVEQRAERGDIIIALGGGVVGDLAGFVAATFLRGLSLVQIPTSLIGMVDAAIGGKTAVNHSQAKNIIGAFYQPRLVIADVETLTTLSQRELISGWAEVIKHGLILDSELFSFLEDSVDDLIRLEPEATTRTVRRSAAIKAEIVSEDEKERGRRTLLNYGHTIAHGLEAATNYEKLLHGEAVAVGMMGAAMLSHKLGLLSWEVVKQQLAILEKFGLPVKCSDVGLKAVLRAMELDKKVRQKKVRWVLLTGIGQSIIKDDVPHQYVKEVLQQLLTLKEELQK